MNIEQFEKDFYTDNSKFDRTINMNLIEKYSNKKDYFNYYLNKENKNSSEMYILGLLYNKGYGTKQNFNESIKWLTNSANQGNANAQNNLGIYYKTVEKNDKEAFKWYTLSANQGNLAAQNNLGNYYDDKKNDKEAFKWYILSANQGNSIAQNNLGVYYDDKKNYEEAIKWYIISANQGNSSAQNNLGVYYFNNKNYEKAKEWYTLSANQGNLTAQNNLGHYYENIEKNYEEALKWYTLSKNEEKIKLLKSKIIKLSKDISITKEEECLICKESFLNNNKSILTIQCSHSFHYDCLKQWQMKCPLCFIDIN